MRLVIVLLKCLVVLVAYHAVDLEERIKVLFALYLLDECFARHIGDYPLLNVVVIFEMKAEDPSLIAFFLIFILKSAIIFHGVHAR